jgi:polar amino acid transport system substrate-binding protein
VQKQKVEILFISLALTMMCFFLTTASGLCSQLKVVNILNILSYETPPLAYEENRETAGIATEIVEKLLKKADTKYFITIYPWEEAYTRAASKENSMIYPLSRTSENEFNFKWIGPIADNSVCLFKLQDGKDINIMAINTLNNYKIGVAKDSPAHKLLLINNISKNLTIEDNIQSTIKQLYNKQVDMIAGNKLELLYQIKKLGLNHNNLYKNFTLIKKNGYYLGFNKFTSKDLFNKVKKAFDQLESSGEIRIIEDNFFNK